MRSACARSRDRAGSGTRPWVTCADCGDRRIHQDKPEADRGSRRDRFRSAIAGDSQWRGLPKAAPTSRLCADRFARARHMLKSGLLQPSKALETVGVYRRTQRYIFFQETEERCTFEIRDGSHSSAPGYTAPFLHSHQDQRGFPSLQLPASPQSGLSPANPGLVDFHFAAQRLAFQVDHCPPQLVEHHPCCLVASQTKLALQKKRREPTLIGGHQISSPEPDRQGDLGVMKDCLRRHRNLVPTAGALPAFQFHQFISTLVPASRTHKPIRPAAGGQVFLTSLFAGELRLKFAQGFRKRRARHPLHYSLWFAETTG